MAGGARRKRGGSWGSGGRSVRQKFEKEENSGKGSTSERNLEVDEAKKLEEQGIKRREEKREEAALSKQEAAAAMSKQHEEAAAMSKQHEAAAASSKQHEAAATATQKQHEGEATKELEEVAKKHEEQEQAADSSGDSAPRKRRNKTHAKKREQAALRKKQEEEMAAVQKEQETAFKKKHEQEMVELNKRHEEEVERLKTRHDREMKAIKTKQDGEAEALQKRQRQEEVEAEELKKNLLAKQLHPADPLSPVVVNSPATPSTTTSPVVSDKGMSPLERHRDFLPEYCVTVKSKGEKGIRKKINKQQQEDDIQMKWNEKESEAQKLKKLEEEVHKKQQQEEDFKQNLDKSLTKAGVSYAESARKAVRKAEIIAQRQAETARNKEAEAKQQADLELKKQQELVASFIKFLGSYIRSGTEGFFYKNLVKFMNEIRFFDLKVDFQDLLMAGELQLGIDLVNANSCELSLLPAVRSFLSAEGLGPIEAVDSKVELTIYRMPHSIVPLSELLENHVDLVINFSNIFGEGYCANTLSHLASALFGGYADYIFDGHEMGRTWNGTFSLHNIPRLDCRKLEERQEEAKDVDYPLYFPELCRDIEDAQIHELGKPWFRVYIVHHPSLKMPLTRHNFVCDASLALEKPCGAELAKIIKTNPAPSKFRFTDWRGPIENSNIYLLTHVYSFGLDKVKGKDRARGAKGKKGGAGRAKGKEGGGSGKRADTHENEPFTGDIKGEVKYDRNLQQHAHGIVDVKSIAEVEVFASMMLAKYIHKIIKPMLARNLMSEDFEDIWIEYRSSRPRTTDGSELQPGPRLLFWD